MRRTAAAILFTVAASTFLSVSSPFTGYTLFGPSVTLAEEGWKAEFDAVCSKTDVAMTLSVEELKDLVALCVQLKTRIEAQEESTRKVYLRRLQMCSDLYIYVLENKERDR